MVVIDADLQDPPELIPKMIEKWREGYEVVYGKRLKRAGETWFKKTTAALFYRFLRSMASQDIPTDAGDFRLLDRRIVRILLENVNERCRYMRGLVAWMGFRQTYVEYDRETGDWLVAANGTPMEWRVRPDGTAERRFMPVDAREV